MTGGNASHGETHFRPKHDEGSVDDLNDYEKKKQDRIDRYRDRAERARAESDALSKQSEDMLHAIPMGQPVMSPADARFRERAGNKMRQSLAASEKAAYYEAKAEAAEKNTAISSDDPEAAKKLTKKLEDLRTRHTFMKNVNTPIYNSAYIEGIHNLYEFDVGEGSGWMYSVNGWYPNYGCSRYALQDGDVVEWRYTCDLGYDVGGGYAVGGTTETD